MRPRSLRSTSGRHRARRPVVVSSRSGRMRPLVINSRTRSAALAANRRSVARATSGSPVTTALHGSAAQRARARRPASPGSRASPGAVHPGRGSPDPGDGDEPGPSGGRGLVLQQRRSGGTGRAAGQPEKQLDLVGLDDQVVRLDASHLGGSEADAVVAEGERVRDRASVPGWPAADVARPCGARCRPRPTRRGARHRSARPSGERAPSHHARRCDTD